MSEPIEKEHCEENDKRINTLKKGVDKLTKKQSPITHFGDKLKQWKPGESGNPKGRPPKNVSITSLVKEILEQEGAQGKTNAQLIAEAMVTLAKDPNKRGFVPALKEVLERIEGKVPDKHEIETGDISIVYKQVKKDD